MSVGSSWSSTRAKSPPTDMTPEALKDKLLDVGVGDFEASILSNLPTEAQRKAVWNAVTKVRFLEALRVLQVVKEEVGQEIDQQTSLLRKAAEGRFV